MNKLICVVGSTGTGKTAKALELAKEYPSIIVSADSRQVYRGMDIVTGKDHPPGVEIFGLDLVDPGEPCSVAVWHTAVMPPILQAWQDQKQVIVVGGTGLFVKSLTDGIDTMDIAINQPLRDELSLLSLANLQLRLESLDQKKFASLNYSDQCNPRRLIRAIEVAQSLLSVKIPTEFTAPESVLLGLRVTSDIDYRIRITQRVMTRLELGAIEETKNLLTKYDKNLQSMTAIGYKSLVAFLENKLSWQDLISDWVEGELQYAKRQLTWFRKVAGIKWYDIE